MDQQNVEKINSILDAELEIREVYTPAVQVWDTVTRTPLCTQKIKEQVTEFDKKTRTLTGILNRIHSTRSDQSDYSNILRNLSTLLIRPTVPALLESARPVLESCRETTTALADIIPADQFWKWKEMWQNSLRNAVFAALLVEYLHSGGLLTLPAVAETLGSTDIHAPH